MAIEWVGTAITGAVGVAGIVGTYVGARSQIEGQKDLAHAERQQRRQEESYTELLLLVAEADDWAYNLMLHFAGPWTDKPYPHPPRIHVRTISSQGTLSMYWSRRMRQLISELQGYMATAFEAWVNNQAARASLVGSGEPRPTIVSSFETFNAAKENISRLADAIRDQAGDELSDRHSGEADETPG